jgi:hypothetical protein
MEDEKKNRVRGIQREQGKLTNLLLFFKNKESGLKLEEASFV